jgi:hypothetical protein
MCNDLDLSCHRKDKEKKKNIWISQKVILNITLRSLSTGGCVKTKIGYHFAVGAY